MASTINRITSHFKKYWLIWFLNACIPFLFIYAFGISNKIIFGSITFAIFSNLSFYYKTLYDERKSNKRIIETGDFLIINGIFSKIRIDSRKIKSIRVSKNFFSKVFDWSKVIVTTYDSEKVIYTKHIKLPVVE